MSDKGKLHVCSILILLVLFGFIPESSAISLSLQSNLKNIRSLFSFKKTRLHLQRNASADVVYGQLPLVCRSNQQWMNAIEQYRHGHHRGIVVWACFESSRCGGLGDRIRGIASMFMLALVTNRSFGIHHEVPQKLSIFYQPTSFLNWEQFSIPNNSSRISLIARFPADGIKFMETLPQSFYVNANMDHVQWMWKIPTLRSRMSEIGLNPNCNDLPCIFACIYPLLFQLAPALRQNHRQILNEHPSFVSIQIRMGGKFAGWRDPVRVSMPLAMKFLAVIRNRTLPTDHLFLTTDSEAIVTYAKRFFRERILFTTAGRIIHMAKLKNPRALDDVTKVYLDHYLIAEGKFAFITYSCFVLLQI